MRNKLVKGAILAGCTMPALLACITVNLYFPESTVKKTAEEIVNDVRGADAGKKEEIKKDAEPAEELVRGPSVQAGQETEVSSPRIRAIKESIKQRFEKLVPFFDAGRLGETNDGSLAIRNEEGLSLQDKSALRKLAKDENQDRSDLYAEVAKALSIDPSQIGRIRGIFAEQWIAKAHPGWMVQKADGSWVKKGSF